MQSTESKSPSTLSKQSSVINQPTNELKQTANLKVIRRNGNLIAFDADKITIAITKAFLDEEGGNAALSSRIRDIADKLTIEVISSLNRQLNYSGAVHVEDIQDQVELALMREEYHKVARSYVLYREQRRRVRENQDIQAKQENILNVKLKDGSIEPLNMAKLNQVVQAACQNLTSVEPEIIVKETLKDLFEGVELVDVYRTLIMSARTLIEQEPEYSSVAARLLLHNINIEALECLKVPKCNDAASVQIKYEGILEVAVEHGVSVGLLDKRLLSFDMKMLGAAIEGERDLKFGYLGLQTLYDRYFLHEKEIRFELPQVFFMRVAMGLAICEDNKNERAIEFYRVLSSFDFMSSTPTLFNSGTVRPQLSSCFLMTVTDDLADIYDSIKSNALLSKFSGGLGNDWTPVRAINSRIKGTNGKSQGVVPFLKVANDTAVAVNQGGKRKGALCSYLETWHLDIEEFLELRKNTGDERRRTHDMNTANWIPDLFMKRVEEKGDWTLFSPCDVPDLHDLYGNDFEIAYTKYEAQAAAGNIKNHKKIKAVTLWRKMLGMVFETGHPWITFKDPCNVRSPQQHIGVVHSSNLCTEITLNTNKDEIAVCNLGSINLPQHVNESGLDKEKLKRTVRTAIRMLDNVIDINYYSVIQARRSNLKHRPIGIGMMGFQDCLYKLDYSYESDDAVEFADRSMEYISYYAIEASSDLAVERGCYESYEGSLWSKGILPIDSIKLLQDCRGQYLQQDEGKTLNWQELRQKVRTSGMRNSNVMAIAPTATISNICGVTQSIEPTYQNLYVKSNLSGEFTMVNPYLVADLKNLGLWDSVMVNDLKYYDGSLKNIDRIPDKIKSKYATAFEIDPIWLVKAGSRRQKWIDQAQSLNLYLKAPSGKKLDNLYRTGWKMGLKTFYYLRTLGATDTEKSTVNTGALNAVAVQGQACSIDDPSCEACQ